MTDQETPGFKVVDRRSSMPDEPVENTGEDAPASPQAASTSEPSAEKTDHREPYDPSPTSEPSDPDLRMPDPAMVLSFAAMQMDLHQLAHTLIAVFDGHAWRAMGLVTDPVSGEPKRDLPAAQLAIDCVQFLAGKVDSHLSEAERRELQRRLNDLRMNYLMKLREG